MISCSVSNNKTHISLSLWLLKYNANSQKRSRIELILENQTQQQVTEGEQ